MNEYNPTLLYDNTPELIISQASTDTPVPLQKVKNANRITTAREDEEITDLIWAASGYIEVKTGRALLSATYLQTQRYFDSSEIELRRTPVTEVTSITYKDADGVTQTVDPTFYYLSAGNGIRPKVILKSNKQWPENNYEANSIEITFKAGVASQQLLDARLKRAVIMLTSHLYNHKDGVVVDAKGAVIEVPSHFNAFINQLKTRHI